MIQSQGTLTQGEGLVRSVLTSLDQQLFMLNIFFHLYKTTYLTLELNLKSGKLELDSLQSFAERFVVMGDGLLRALAEREGEVGVRFLAVVVGPHGVHPQYYLLAIVVLKLNNL
jgi:hypothetical protein